MDLRSMVRDARAMKDGEYQQLGPEFGSIEVKVRAMGGAYTDMLANLRRAAARKHGGLDNIPAEAEGKMIVEAVISTVLVDARADETDTIDGAPVSRDTLAALLREPGAAAIANAVMLASSRVGHARTEDAEAASGN